MRLSYGVCVKLTVACGMEASVLGPERPEDSEASQLGFMVRLDDLLTCKSAYLHRIPNSLFTGRRSPFLRRLPKCARSFCCFLGFSEFPCGRSGYVNVEPKL